MMSDAREIVSPGLVGGTVGAYPCQHRVLGCRSPYAYDVGGMARPTPVESTESHLPLSVRRGRWVGPCRNRAPYVRLINEGFGAFVDAGNADVWQGVVRVAVGRPHESGHACPDPRARDT